MKEKDEVKTGKGKFPYSRKVMMTVLASVVFMGGGFGGYWVSTEPPTKKIIGSGFDDVTHVVVDVSDGDSFVIEGGHRVRMLGISAPETKACYGMESKEFLSQMILGREVLLQKDSDSVDELGRLLRYVFLYEGDASKDNIFINNLMITEGLAVSDLRGANKRYEKLFNVSLGKARNSEAGLHGACEPLEEPELLPLKTECTIKGNLNKNNDNKIYYLEGCPNYSSIKMKASENDQYFCTEEEAIESGFRKAGNCPK